MEFSPIQGNLVPKDKKKYPESPNYWKSLISQLQVRIEEKFGVPVTHK